MTTLSVLCDECLRSSCEDAHAKTANCTNASERIRSVDEVTGEEECGLRHLRLRCCNACGSLDCVRQSEKCKGVCERAVLVSALILTGVLCSIPTITYFTLLVRTRASTITTRRYTPQNYSSCNQL